MSRLIIMLSGGFMIVCKNRFLLCLVIFTTYQPIVCLKWQRYVPAWFRMPTRKESLTIGAGLFVIAASAYLLSKRQKPKKTESTSSTSNAPQPPIPAAVEPPPHVQPIALKQGQYHIPEREYGWYDMPGVIILKPHSHLLPSHLVAVIEAKQEYTALMGEDAHSWMSNNTLFNLTEKENKPILQVIPDVPLTNYKLLIHANAKDLKNLVEQYQEKTPQEVLREYIDQEKKWEADQKKRKTSPEYQHQQYLAQLKSSITESQLFYTKSPHPPYLWECEALLKKIQDSKLALYTFHAYQATTRDKKIVLQLKYFISSQHGIFSDFIAWGFIKNTDNYTYYLIEQQGMYQVGGSQYGKEQVFENIECKEGHEVEKLTEQFLSEAGR